MRGTVLQYDDNAGTGLISGDDGNRYTFRRAELQQLRPITAGNKVDFIPSEGTATEIYLMDHASAPAALALTGASPPLFDCSYQSSRLWGLWPKEAGTVQGVSALERDYRYGAKNYESWALRLRTQQNATLITPYDGDVIDAIVSECLHDADYDSAAAGESLAAMLDAALS